MSAAHGLLFCRLAIAVLFVASAFGKLSSRRDFEISIEGFKLLRDRRLVALTATVVMAAEVGVVVLLGVGGPLLVPGFLLATALLVGFSVVLGHALRRRMEVSCNCFGPGIRLISPWDVLRNTVMILFAVGGLVLVRVDQAPVAAGAAVLLAGMSIVFVLAMSNLGDIATTLRGPL
ncbi:MAG TPA: MauE/DoxX family redox-associated membrane protein [Micromonosporaceae bacterium]|nr:MauE/DoxX family redox-associated membrane protein [Micromonosporaceae bacterium]